MFHKIPQFLALPFSIQRGKILANCLVLIKEAKSGFVVEKGGCLSQFLLEMSTEQGFQYTAVKWSLL